MNSSPVANSSHKGTLIQIRTMVYRARDNPSPPPSISPDLILGAVIGFAYREKYMVAVCF